MPPRRIYLVAVLAVLLLLCLAITACFVASPRPQRVTQTPVPVSDNAAQSGEDKINAVADAPLGPFSVDITDQEASSLLALRLPGSPFLNPQVRFLPDQFYVSGVVNMGVPLNVASQWTIANATEQPRIVLERASIGPFALPSILLNSVSSTINEMIKESGTGVMPTAIHSSDGHIVIEGTKSTPTVP